MPTFNVADPVNLHLVPYLGPGVGLGPDAFPSPAALRKVPHMHSLKSATHLGAPMYEKQPLEFECIRSLASMRKLLSDILLPADLGWTIHAFSLGHTDEGDVTLVVSVSNSHLMIPEEKLAEYLQDVMKIVPKTASIANKGDEAVIEAGSSSTTTSTSVATTFCLSAQTVLAIHRDFKQTAAPPAASNPEAFPEPEGRRAKSSGKKDEQGARRIFPVNMAGDRYMVEGSLWGPIPINLPSTMSLAAARRTLLKHFFPYNTSDGDNLLLLPVEAGDYVSRSDADESVDQKEQSAAVGLTAEEEEEEDDMRVADLVEQEEMSHQEDEQEKSDNSSHPRIRVRRAKIFEEDSDEDPEYKAKTLGDLCPSGDEVLLGFPAANDRRRRSSDPDCDSYSANCGTLRAELEREYFFLPQSDEENDENEFGGKESLKKLRAQASSYQYSSTTSSVARDAASLTTKGGIKTLGYILDGVGANFVSEFDGIPLPDGVTCSVDLKLRSSGTKGPAADCENRDAHTVLAKSSKSNEDAATSNSTKANSSFPAESSDISLPQEDQDGSRTAGDTKFVNSGGPASFRFRIGIGNERPASSAAHADPSSGAGLLHQLITTNSTTLKLWDTFLANAESMGAESHHATESSKTRVGTETTASGSIYDVIEMMRTHAQHCTLAPLLKSTKIVRDFGHERRNESKLNFLDAVIPPGLHSYNRITIRSSCSCSVGRGECQPGGEISGAGPALFTRSLGKNHTAVKLRGLPLSSTAQSAPYADEASDVKDNTRSTDAQPPLFSHLAAEREVELGQYLNQQTSLPGDVQKSLQYDFPVEFDFVRLDMADSLLREDKLAAADVDAGAKKQEDEATKPKAHSVFYDSEDEKKEEQEQEDKAKRALRAERQEERRKEDAIFSSRQALQLATVTCESLGEKSDDEDAEYDYQKSTFERIWGRKIPIASEWKWADHHHHAGEELPDPKYPGRFRLCKSRSLKSLQERIGPYPAPRRLDVAHRSFNACPPAAAWGGLAQSFIGSHGTLEAHPSSQSHVPDYDVLRRRDIIRRSTVGTLLVVLPGLRSSRLAEFHVDCGHVTRRILLRGASWSEEDEKDCWETQQGFRYRLPAGFRLADIPPQYQKFLHREDIGRGAAHLSSDSADCALQSNTEQNKLRCIALVRGARVRSYCIGEGQCVVAVFRILRKRASSIVDRAALFDKCWQTLPRDSYELPSPMTTKDSRERTLAALRKTLKMRHSLANALRSEEKRILREKGVSLEQYVDDELFSFDEKMMERVLTFEPDEVDRAYRSQQRLEKEIEALWKSETFLPAGGIVVFPSRNEQYCNRDLFPLRSHQATKPLCWKAQLKGQDRGIMNAVSQAALSSQHRVDYSRVDEDAACVRTMMERQPGLTDAELYYELRLVAVANCGADSLAESGANVSQVRKTDFALLTDGLPLCRWRGRQVSDFDILSHVSAFASCGSSMRRLAEPALFRITKTESSSDCDPTFAPTPPPECAEKCTTRTCSLPEEKVAPSQGEPETILTQFMEAIMLTERMVRSCEPTSLNRNRNPRPQLPIFGEVVPAWWSLEDHHKSVDLAHQASLDEDDNGTIGGSEIANPQLYYVPTEQVPDDGHAEGSIHQVAPLFGSSMTPVAASSNVTDDKNATAFPLSSISYGTSTSSTSAAKRASPPLSENGRWLNTEGKGGTMRAQLGVVGALKLIVPPAACRVKAMGVSEDNDNYDIHGDEAVKRNRTRADKRVLDSLPSSLTLLHEIRHSSSSCWPSYNADRIPEEESDKAEGTSTKDTGATFRIPGRIGGSTSHAEKQHAAETLGQQLQKVPQLDEYLSSWLKHGGVNPSTATVDPENPYHRDPFAVRVELLDLLTYFWRTCALSRGYSKSASSYSDLKPRQQFRDSVTSLMKGGCITAEDRYHSYIGYSPLHGYGAVRRSRSRKTADCLPFTTTLLLPPDVLQENLPRRLRQEMRGVGAATFAWTLVFPASERWGATATAPHPGSGTTSMVPCTYSGILYNQLHPPRYGYRYQQQQDSVPTNTHDHNCGVLSVAMRCCDAESDCMTEPVLIEDFSFGSQHDEWKDEDNDPREGRAQINSANGEIDIGRIRANDPKASRVDYELLRAAKRAGAEIFLRWYLNELDCYPQKPSGTAEFTTQQEIVPVTSHVFPPAKISDPIETATKLRQTPREVGIMFAEEAFRPRRAIQLRKAIFTDAELNARGADVQRRSFASRAELRKFLEAEYGAQYDPREDTDLWVAPLPKPTTYAVNAENHAAFLESVVSFRITDDAEKSTADKSSLRTGNGTSGEKRAEGANKVLQQPGGDDPADRIDGEKFVREHAVFQLCAVFLVQFNQGWKAPTRKRVPSKRKRDEMTTTDKDGNEGNDDSKKRRHS